MLFLVVIVALLPALIAAKGQLGFALGNKKPDGTCKFKSDYIEDLKTLDTLSKIVRIYAASNCDAAKELLPAAQAQGVKVVLGIWPDTDESFQKDKSAVLTYAPQYADQVYAVTVGSESLYRGNFTGEQLLSKILDVKEALGGKFKVGTADSWNKFHDGTADPVIKGGADIILCNAFSYWQGQAIADASSTLFDDIFQAFGHIQNVAGGADKAPELWVGEAGWPSAGQRYQNAQPGITEASTFWSQSICGIRMWGVNIFSFEAFDEPWKPKSVGTDGNAADETHWGVFNADRSPKFAISSC
ncbi:Glucan 1,3-beta-glucosidase [Erysiphe necator]|uniref:glucan 1,3-beta-glucosidase n=1 Tax=Uncinula necator TaxID=52586 RepID=A0A0B1PAA4_UNCNE|nr:Glucan 1,3-beta-glucosidase [Erysiphe necator]KHJ35178.1 putative glycoside hydrolase family 17 protein [Erysiphe necator]